MAYKLQFENLLTHQLNEFGTELEGRISQKLDIKLETFRSETNARFDSIEKRLNILIWLTPLLFIALGIFIKFVK